MTWADLHGLADASLRPRLLDPFMAALPDYSLQQQMDVFRDSNKHPNFWHLNVLVFSAVLEVVCVSLPGYIVARQGMFDADAQTFLANLNVMLFTPCLIWTKLASQLNGDKLSELAIIPLIFAVQTFVSYVTSIGISKIFRFKKRPQNFVTAMAVFGNSNSLPISLIISLAKTLPGLHWDKIPHDSDDEVAARGILYLLIFQQLGQLVRWSWGYHVLLKSPDKYSVEDGGVAHGLMEEGRAEDRYNEEASTSAERSLLLPGDQQSTSSGEETLPTARTHLEPGDWEHSGAATPLNRQKFSASTATLDELHTHGLPPRKPLLSVTNTNDSVEYHPDDPISPTSTQTPSNSRWAIFRTYIAAKFQALGTSIAAFFKRVFASLPPSTQKALKAAASYVSRFFTGLWAFMNPPLWAMLFAIIVATVPDLQRLFFTRGTFLNTSVTRAIEQSGGVAVPLILVVLGANLARNTIPQSQLEAEDPKLERKILIAALVSRMLIPILVMAPILAFLAKFAPVSIVDDPVFVVVCFLLTGAPSALQLAQICQLNGVYIGAMTNILFQSYVIWILPSTLILVVMAIEVVKWAA